MTVMDQNLHMDLVYDDTFREHQQQQYSPSSTSSASIKQISPTMARKCSRKLLERKNHFDYDDVVINLSTTTNEEYVDMNNDELLNSSTNANRVFDELFATASATIHPEMQYCDYAIRRRSSSRNTSQKSITKMKTPSPPLYITTPSIDQSQSQTVKASSNEYVSTSNTRKNFLGLEDAEQYLGTPQTLTRSVSCKRPASFKRMKSRNSINNSNSYAVTATLNTLKVDQQNMPTNTQIMNIFKQDQQQQSQNRACSLPFENLDVNIGDDMYRMRRFTSTSKGAVINRGDSFKRSFKRSNNNNLSIKKHGTDENVSTTNAITAAAPIVLCSDGSINNMPTLMPVVDSLECNEKTVNNDSIDTFTVLIMGSTDVGKSAMTKQFKTSEYHGTYDINMSMSVEDDVEELISVMLDGIESNLILVPIDIENNKQMRTTILDHISSRQVDAYIVCYSLTDQSSLQVAIDILKTIRISESRPYPIILVGNKSDLARKRAISREDGRNLALKYSCKFIETSVAINDKVDDLLAGTLKQIRLANNDAQKENITNNKQINKQQKTKILLSKFKLTKKNYQTGTTQELKVKNNNSFFRKIFRQLFSQKNNQTLNNSVENLFTLPK